MLARPDSGWSSIEKMFAGFQEKKLKHPIPDSTPGERKNYYELFEFETVDGVDVSEDLTFCKRWKELRGEIWCDPTAEISHIGTHDYRGPVSELFTIKEDAA